MTSEEEEPRNEDEAGEHLDSEETERERRAREGFDVSHLNLGLIDAVANMQRQFATQFAPLLGSVAGKLLPQLDQLFGPPPSLFQQFVDISSLFPEIGVSPRGLWPRNLDDIIGPSDVGLVKALMLDEGLPIAWVPGEDAMRAVLNAGSRVGRRAVYGRRWRSIVQDCDNLYERMDSVTMAPYRRFLGACIRMMEDEHHEGAQALATNTLDSLTHHFIPLLRRDWTGKDPLKEPDELPIRDFFMACQLWGVYRPNWPNRGDPAPASYSRHATTHRVSIHRQYSRLNATLAVAHLSSFMWMLDSAYHGR